MQRKVVYDKSDEDNILTSWKGIYEGKENALENYLSFLKTGGSDYPANELKIAGVDVTSPEVVESAIKMFDNVIDEFKTLYEKM